MIYIKQNTENNVVLTLSEYIDIEFPTYDVLFKFINDTTGEEKIFAAADISPATGRYNQFNIEENITENLSAGIVSLTPEGYWSYYIYQMETASPPNLNPDDAIKVLEIGKVLVTVESETVTPTFDNDDDKNNVVFE